MPDLLDSPCRLYGDRISDPGSPSGRFIDERATWEYDCDRFCDGEGGDVMTICTQYIQCVPLDEIEEMPPWNKHRERSAREWGNRHTLNRLPISRTAECGCGGGGIAAVQKHGRMVRLSRNYDLRKPIDEQEKFRISDGIHRTNRAREVGAGCILALVDECISFRRSDVDLYRKR